MPLFFRPFLRPAAPAAWLTASLALGLLLGGCGKGPSADDPAAAGAAASAAAAVASGGGASGAQAAAPAASAASAPPVSVTLVRVQQRDVPVQVNATGTVSALTSVDIRPQLTSVVTKVHVREGQFVQAGQPMFTLDSRADEANVAKAVAQMARDEASLADARRQLQRSRELLAQNFVSQGAVDASAAQVEAQTAAVAADRAAVDAARVALSYARITAPSSGRIGVINVFPGSSVQANQTTLVTLTQLDPIAVSFSLPQRYLPDLLDALKTGGTQVGATLPESKATLKGKLQFVDSAVDAATGTVKVKAMFPNADSRLWPGAFVNVALTLRTLKDAVVVPQAAIVQGTRGTFVFTAKDGVAVPRPVEILTSLGEDAAVGGLRGGERIVLDGRQNVRPGSTLIERAREGGRAASGAAGGASGAGRGGGASGAAGTSGAPGAPSASTPGGSGRPAAAQPGASS